MIRALKTWKRLPSGALELHLTVYLWKEAGQILFCFFLVGLFGGFWFFWLFILLVCLFVCLFCNGRGMDYLLKFFFCGRMKANLIFLVKSQAVDTVNTNWEL